jgi:Ion transport protein
MKISLNSSTKVTSYVDPARIKYLWSKARQAVRSYIIFKRMGSDIRTFGTTQKTEFKINTPKSFAIHPRSLAKRTFNTLILILLALDSIFLPYYLCFFSESKQWKYMKLLENIIYAIDCILSFFTSYWHHEHTLITDKNIIIRNYLKTWFLLDIITLLPYQFLPSGYILLSLLCLLKYFKILSFSMRFLKFYKTSMNHLLLRLIETLFAVVIMVQVLSCLWFYISKLQGFPLDCWMVHFNLTDKSDFYIYLTCIYWVFTTITTVGFGDITPQSLTEKVFAMIVMAVGVSFYSLTVGNITKIISTMDHKKRLLDSKLNTLEILSKEYSLPSFIKDKIKDTVIQNSSENLSLYNETQLVFELPSSLRSEVSLHLYKSIIQKIKFFQLKDPSFLSFVVPKLTNMNCVPHKYIYRIDDEVYDSNA